MSPFARITQMNENFSGKLAAGYSVGLFVMLAVCHFFPSATDANITGRMWDGQMLILGYYFGSSASSREKNAIFADKKDS